jgi:hypothetical protein
VERSKRARENISKRIERAEPHGPLYRFDRSVQPVLTVRQKGACEPRMRRIGIDRQGTVNGIGSGGVVTGKERDCIGRHRKDVRVVFACLDRLPR